MVGEDGAHICMRVCGDGTPNQLSTPNLVLPVLTAARVPHTGSATQSLAAGMGSPSPHCSPQSSAHPQQGLGGPARPRDLRELTEKQLPLWAHSMRHENTLVTRPHSHQGSQGWEDTTGLPSTLLGLTCPLMWLCPPSLRWMRRLTSRTSSTASPSASGSR